jgi:hypothetical protein
MYGWLVGKYQVQVRTNDGEGWSDWSATYASHDLPSTVSVQALQATAIALAPSLEPSVRVLAAKATAYPGQPGYTNGVFLEVSRGSALAKGITPWSHLTEVASSSAFGDTTVLAIGALKYQVRVADAEGFGVWSTEQAAVQSKPLSNVYLMVGGVWQRAIRQVLQDGVWVQHQPVAL